MRQIRRPARINVKAVAVLILVITGLAVAAAVAYRVRQELLVERSLTAGKLALERGDWPAACQHLKLYLSKRPEDVEMLARYADANLLIRPRRVGVALAAYRQLLRHMPGDDVVCEQLAELYFERHEFSEAAYICRQRLEVDPADPDATLVLGRVLRIQRRYDEAAEHLIRLVKNHPEEVKAYLLLSSLALAGDSISATDQAAGWLDRAVEANPRSVEARVHRARFRRTVANKRDAAREDLQAADALPMEDPGVGLLLADEWMNLGDFARAQAQLDVVEQVDVEEVRQFDIDPDDYALSKLLMAGKLALLSGQANRCSELANQALDELPEYIRGRFLPFSVDLYLADGQVRQARQAVEDYRAILAGQTVASPSADQLLTILDASVAEAEGSPHTVIDLLTKLVVADPDQPLAWRLLWRAYDKTGQGRRAEEALEEYVDRRPDDAGAALALARIYRGHDWSKVLQYAARAEQSSPDDLEPKLLRIEATLFGSTQERTASRLEALNQELFALQTSHPDKVAIRLLRSSAAVIQDQPDEAVAILEAAITDCTDSLPAVLQLASLHARSGRLEDALSVCHAAMPRHGDVASLWLALAELQTAAGRPSDARATLAQGARELTGEQQRLAGLALARFLIAHHEQSDAVELLRKLAAEQSNDARPRLALLGIPEVQERIQESQALINELKGIEGDSGLRWRLEQARLWLRSDNWKQRQQEIGRLARQCISTDPHWSAPVLVLGRMYEMAGDDTRAEDLYRRTMDASPGQADVAVRLLMLLEGQNRFADLDAILESLPADLPKLEPFRLNASIRRGQYDSPIEYLRRRIDQHRDDAEARVLLARLIYRQRRDADTALSLLEEALSIAPDLWPAVSGRAAVLHDEGRDEDALALLNAAVDRRGDYAAYRLRAEFFVETDRLDSAERDYIRLTTLKESSADGFALLGAFYQQAGRIDDAIRTWEAGLQADPEHMDLQRLLVQALLRHANPPSRQRGREMLRRLLHDAPNDADLLAVQAHLLLGERTEEAVQQAVGILERVVRLDPRNVAAHRQLIELARRRGDRERTNELLFRALGANPGNVELIVDRATAEAQQNNKSTARRLARSVLERDSQNVRARNLLVSLALEDGDVAAAETLNDDVLRIDPDNEAAGLAKAKILLAGGRPQEAIQGLETLRESDAGHESVPVCLALAELYRRQGDTDMAERRINQAEELAPEDPAIHRERLYLLAARERFDEIKTQFDGPEARHPNDVALLLLAGKILASAGTPALLLDAKTFFERVLALEPSHVEGHFNLAQVAHRLGDADLSVRTYRRVLELDPYHPKALNDLAWILGVLQDKPQEAIELADRGLVHYPDQPNLLDTRGVLLTRLGRPAEAQRDLQKCVQVAADLPRTQAHALLHLARIHVQQGEFPAAAEVLDDALRIHRETGVLTADECAEIDHLIEAVSGSTGDPEHPEDKG